MAPEKSDFYLRFYAEKKGKSGQDFLEMEFNSDGKLSYAYNSQKKEQSVIRREAFVTEKSLDKLKRLVADSGITKFPAKSFVSRVPDSHQELEITLDGKPVLLSPHPMKEGATKEAEGKRKNIADNFYAVVNDVKCLFFSLVGASDYKVETF